MAKWLGKAFARHDGQTYAVGYKHHLERVEVNPGETEIFYTYRARENKGDEHEGFASDWSVEFADTVKRSGKMIIAEPEWNAGKLVRVGRMECGRESLLIEVHPVPFEHVRFELVKKPYDYWEPDGYSDPDHIRNHPNVRR